LSRQVTLAYGAHYSNYGYLDRGSLFSPTAGVTITPVHRLRIDAFVSRRMLAPGAEEFVPPSNGGVWLPPERTFSSLESDGLFRPERTDHYQVQFEHDLAAHTFVGVRTYYQRVNDQLLTVFDMTSDVVEQVGHYYVGNVGGFEARGWGASVGHAIGDRVRGVVDYSVTTALWQSSPDPELASFSTAGSAVRTRERIHDIRTQVSADVPETATRVFVVYRVNNAFMTDENGEGAGPRFDLQINQSLPFMKLMATEWEMLVAIRNLFREAAFDGSVYDELLVVRPPKRIVGGLTVRF
jgi:outer membrane receptor protein involved in Fe transport